MLDQNDGGAGTGDEWILLSSIPVADPAQPITVTQEVTGTNTFVSMRAYGLLFEIGPEGTPIPVETMNFSVE